MSEKKIKEERKEAPAINWRVAADRNVYGERVELKTLPGYWVQPRRYSKQGEAEITAVAARSQMKKANVRRAILSEQDTSAMSEADKMGGMSAEMKDKVLDAVMGSMTAEEISGLETQIVEIAYGVNLHNFTGEQEPATPAWARSLVEYKDIFDEILSLVEAKNLPL